jgi:hypothetical protein
MKLDCWWCASPARESVRVKLIHRRTGEKRTEALCQGCADPEGARTIWMAWRRDEKPVRA